MTIHRLAIVLKRRLNLGRRLACSHRVAGTEKQRQQKRQKSEQYNLRLRRDAVTAGRRRHKIPAPPGLWMTE